MDRISGSYKRWAKRWLIVITLVVAAILHVALRCHRADPVDQ